MSLSPFAIVLLADFAPTNPHFATLKSILEEAKIQVAIPTERISSSDTKEWLVDVCAKHHPSLVIQSLDQRLLRDKAPDEFPSLPSFDIPIIVAAHDFEAAQIGTMLELGASDFITPPFTAVSILPRIWRLLRHHDPGPKACSTLHVRMAMQRLGLIGRSPVFLEEIKKLRLLARCDITVMIGGETGTGKELVARAVHYLSARADRPFVPIDCGAIPPELTESELFGHKRGAFTGAIAGSPGLIAAAHEGTLFLDEVDALNLTVQAKLLRFLQEMEYRPVGSSEMKKADVRVISATNRDLLDKVRTNEFRKDLYYRLNVVQLRLPSLRQRREDIALLARHFVSKYVARFKQPQCDLTPNAIQKLLTYCWPGNIRELENVVGAAVALCDGPLIRADHLLLAEAGASAPASFREAKAQMIAEFEREYIRRLLNSFDGNVSQAARAAGKNRRAFWELMRKHRINVHGVRNVEGAPATRKGHVRARGFATS